jgi:hypothetical protein
MRKKQCQYRGAIFVLLTVFGGIISPFIVTNLETVAQTPSTQMQCSEVEIKNYIQQLSNGEQPIYDAIVACKDKATPELIKALKNQNKQVRIMAITALGEIGSHDAVSPLSNLLSNEKDQDVRIATVFALSKFGKQGVPTLITALKDKDRYIRYQTVNALNEIGSDAKDAIPALNDAVKDKNLIVSSAATRALVGIKKQELSVDTGTPVSTGTTSRVESAVKDDNLNVSSAAVDSAMSGTETNTPISSASGISKRLTQQSKPLLMCQVPALRTIFKWKCLQNSAKPQIIDKNNVQKVK